MTTRLVESALVSLGLAACAGCAHGRLAIEPAQRTPASASSRPSHPDFRAAVEDAVFDSAALDQAGAEERAFAGALRSVVEGRPDEAEPPLRELIRSASDEELRRQAGRLLAEALLHGSRWADAESVINDLVPASQAAAGMPAAFKELEAETVELPDREQQLRLERSLAGTPVVEVLVNGRRRRFWIDTGAGVTIVASHVAEECGLTPLGSRDAALATATTRVVGARPTVIAELRLGDAVFRNHPALILRRDDLRFRLFGLITVVAIDGILGWPAIEKLDLTIDLPGERLLVRRPRKRDEPRNLFWTRFPIVRGLGPAGEPLLLGLDTGGRRTSARDRLVRKTGVSVVRQRVRRVRGAGGSAREESRTLAPIALDVDGCRLRFDRLETGLREHAIILKLDGVLGADIAAHTRLRIDATNGRFDCVPAGR